MKLKIEFNEQPEPIICEADWVEVNGRTLHLRHTVAAVTTTSSPMAPGPFDLDRIKRYEIT